MATEWRVCETNGNGRKYWNVYRLRSVCAPDMDGNRIYCGVCFDTQADAQRYANMLNDVPGLLQYDFMKERKRLNEK